jgi:hypothetical protein
MMHRCGNTRDGTFHQHLHQSMGASTLHLRLNANPLVLLQGASGLVSYHRTTPIGVIRIAAARKERKSAVSFNAAP